MLNLFKDIVSIPCFFNKALISRTLPRLWLATTIFLGNLFKYNHLDNWA